MHVEWGVARLYRASIAGWMLCLALGSFSNAGVSVAGESKTAASARSTSRMPETPLETPMDATMSHLAHLERMAGVNSAHLSAAGRNLFSLAERWTVIRERLVKAAVRPAHFDELLGARSISQNPPGNGHRSSKLTLLGIHAE